MKRCFKKFIVLTGGSGLIGAAVLKTLNDQGYTRILVVDDLGSTEQWKNLVGKHFVDLIHKETLFSWLEGRHDQIRAFIHLGACSSTVEKNANFLLENNYRYTVRLAEYALTHGLRFIYASSAATYGDGKLGFSDDHAKLEQWAPLNMYGFSKHLVDLWLLRRGALDQVVGLKYFNVFGPGEYHKGRMASVILKMVPDALRDGKISLFKSTEPDKYPDGGQIRDFLYVKDAAEMTVQFLERPECGIYNIGTGKEQTWLELAQAVIKALDKPIKIEFIETPPDLIGKYQNYTCAAMEKSRAADLLLPRYSLEEAVREYVQEYLLEGKSL